GGSGGVVPGDRVVGEDGDLHAAGGEDRRLVGGGRVLAGAARDDPVRSEVGDRLEDARAAGVTDVVVGDPDVIDPGVGEALDEFRIGREGRSLRVVVEVV